MALKEEEPKSSSKLNWFIHLVTLVKNQTDISVISAALSKVCEKANSVKTATVDAPTWIHKYIIGKNGSNIKKITQDFSKVNTTLFFFLTYEYWNFYCIAIGLNVIHIALLLNLTMTQLTLNKTK